MGRLFGAKNKTRVHLRRSQMKRSRVWAVAASAVAVAVGSIGMLRYYTSSTDQQASEHAGAIDHPMYQTDFRRLPVHVDWGVLADVTR